MTEIAGLRRLVIQTDEQLLVHRVRRRKWIVWPCLQQIQQFIDTFVVGSPTQLCFIDLVEPRLAR
ncbi:MAG TPA: hypothetical protein VH196_02320, partial [Terriglobales bacterium]|nr:hypothetical protein [Terriglobales bacterium]